jgi:hypothetical protein
LCDTSIASSSRGHVHGGAPAPVRFSSVWSKLSRRLVCMIEANGPRRFAADMTPRTAPPIAPDA